MDTVELARKRKEDEEAPAEEDAGSGTDVTSLDSETLGMRYQDAKNKFGKNHPTTMALANAIADRHADMVSHKKRMVAHMKGKHKRKGDFEGMKVSELHRRHEDDHSYGGVSSHTHEPDMEPQGNRYAELSQTYGEPERFDAWGNKIELATKTVDYGNGTKVVHHSEGKRDSKKSPRGKRPSYAKGNYVGFAGLVKRIVASGKTEEEAKAIAAAIGRKKYGSKFAAIAKKRGAK